jgi:hypothetical protein
MIAGATADGPEGVITNLGLDSGGAGAPADHGVGIRLGQRGPGELAGRAADGANLDEVERISI